MPNIARIQHESFAEYGTGCDGAGDSFEYAESQGFPYCTVFEDSSSAGDWTFLVSSHGEIWYVMTQENNFPKEGFSREIHDHPSFFGTEEDAIAQMAEYSRRG